MDEKLNLKFPLIVEGKYDKVKVSQIVASPIIALDGFSVFNNQEKQKLLKRLSSEGGVILLTDSDRAGNFIRSKLKGMLNGKIYNVYAPAILGKERRKKEPSKDGLLGVEGISVTVLKDLLIPFVGDDFKKGGNITKSRFFEDGFSGNENSAVLRMKLAKMLSLPETLTANALLEAINLLISEEEYLEALKRINDE